MRKLMAVAALLMVAGTAWGQTVTQDGQRTYTGAGQLGGMWVRADSTMQVFTSDGSQRLYVREGTPINTVATYYPDFYGGTSADTFSVNGRTMDSTTVLSVVGYTRVSHVLKMEGHHGAAGNAVAVGVTALCSFATGTNDTTMTFPIQAQGPYARYVADSLLVGTTAGDATAHQPFNRTEHIVYFQTHTAISINSNVIRTRVLEFLLPAGARSVRFIYRVLSDEATAPTQGAKFRIRTSVGLSAL